MKSFVALSILSQVSSQSARFPALSDGFSTPKCTACVPGGMRVDWVQRFFEILSPSAKDVFFIAE